ncbi:MAG TPA: DeoR/GlpR transcriptional regulator, partial [Clostridiaceae bacterium]|nr:DeoR/GlpR transcriptional regulator [Clostridiaceae bacterium]
KRTAIKNSQKSYVVADTSKFFLDAFNNFASLNEFDGIVTDSYPGDHLAEFCKTNDMLLLYKENDEDKKF